jgi:hypothetical protein
MHCGHCRRWNGEVMDHTPKILLARLYSFRQPGPCLVPSTQFTDCLPNLRAMVVARSDAIPLALAIIVRYPNRTYVVRRPTTTNPTNVVVVPSTVSQSVRLLHALVVSVPRPSWRSFSLSSQG